MLADFHDVVAVTEGQHHARMYAVQGRRRPLRRSCWSATSPGGPFRLIGGVLEESGFSAVVAVDVRTSTAIGGGLVLALLAFAAGADECAGSTLSLLVGLA